VTPPGPGRVGIATAALDESVRDAQLRETFGKLLAQRQELPLNLGGIATRVAASRLLVEQTP
jgi:alkylation response protein AidB-like acyl-CoA dehydrogenase